MISPITKNITSLRKGDVLYTRGRTFGEAAVIDLNFDFAIYCKLKPF